MTDPVMAEQYDRMVGRFPWKRVTRKILKQIDGVLGGPPASLLDVACGPAHLLQTLEDQLPGADLHGLDISPPMLALAEKRLASDGGAGSVKLHKGSAYELPFDDGTFDAVVSTDALHSFEEPQRLFSEMVRVARPGGVVVVSAWRRDVPWWIWQLGQAQTRWLKARGSHLEGGGPVLAASYTAAEIAAAAAACTDANASVVTGLVELVLIMQKAALAPGASA